MHRRTHIPRCTIIVSHPHGPRTPPIPLPFSCNHNPDTSPALLYRRPQASHFFYFLPPVFHLHLYSRGLSALRCGPILGSGRGACSGSRHRSFACGLPISPSWRTYYSTTQTLCILYQSTATRHAHLRTLTTSPPAVEPESVCTDRSTYLTARRPS